ncbi:hypothetical protein INS49_005342 [Diaporthe citri]|uniref:uncharacterized protein n=1 Tax=Diaporthe citri TaxID=83186 RepID=UPI001C7F6F86|nr:uncharacterized protein INS49_005342 [Diaporthe citri]KAG6353634.1 hypothetical protein INS49_005342 [Diaporthe citri]
MSPKRDHEIPDTNASRKKFKKRGDLGIYNLATQSDCAVMVGDERLLLHKAMLISRSGAFKKQLTKTGKMPVDHRGGVVLTIDSHDIKSVRLVAEFIYGAASVEILEYQSKDQPIIQDCILLYNLGHEFDIHDMVVYATRHLGMYLSKKLKDICLYPVPKAMQAIAPRAFIDDLEAGITQAYETEPIEEDPNLPRHMLIDFVLAGRDVLFRDADLRFRISQGMLPAAFANEVLLAQYGPGYKTPWMKKLMVRPEKLNKKPEEMKKKRSCAGCGEGITKDETMVFNPWSGPNLSQRYTQVCCEECAQEMDKGKGKGVSWGVFDDAQE